MVSTSKILTVSYGTFSCTLEGFDDSFDTMKAIAEYFRDLASDDRYFGAEPPTPDAEMLARIAEREIERRVDATQNQGQIVLRAHPAAPLVAAGAAAQVDADQDKALAEEDVAETVAAPEPTVDPVAEVETPVVPEPVLPEAEEVAEVETPDLSNPERAADIAETATPVDDLAEDDTADHNFDNDTYDTAAAAEFYEDTGEDELVYEDDVQAPVAKAYTPVPHPDQDSVASKLQRIRAVVSKAEDEADTGYSEDEHAEDFLAETAADLDEALAEDDVAETALIEDESDDISSLLESLTSHDEDDSGEDETQTAEIEAVEEDDYEPVAEDDDLAEVAEVEDEDEDDADDDFDMSNLLNTDDVDEAEANNEDDVAEAETPLRARVVKMKRADFEAAVEKGSYEEVDDDETETVAPKPASSLTAEAEAELQRELAELEAELGDDFDEPVAEAPEVEVEAEVETDDVEAEQDDKDDVNFFAEDDDEDEAETSDQPQGRAQLQAADTDDEMGRILKETNNQLDEPEGKNRRSAIAHLRAAVAATMAEKKAGSDLGNKDDHSDAYRDDLASVVRPRRPHVVSEATRSQRPAENRPAPLKLVAEQRVDEANDKPQDPVQPRRVSMATLAAQTADDTSDALNDSGSFAEFAEEMGATKLPDLLEAAAAYMSFVEGHDQFSRPQLMNVVRQAGSGNVNREDGLRSFGQLLRQGKIEKLKGGRFTVSDRISFKPDARNVG